MATRTITLPGESITAVHTQRVLAAASGLADCPVAPGVGTGYTPAVVGKMNGQFGATPNHFSVSATGTTMVLTIQPGVLWAVVDSGAASYDPRVLLWEMDATATATVTANASGTSRTDTVCVKLAIGTAPDTVGGNIGTIVILAGGASNALANAPVDGSLYIPLCNVVVANGATFVANANLTDKRMVHPSQARARMAATTAATSVVTGGTVQQNFDTILKDPSGMCTTGAAAHFTCPLPGSYLVITSAIFNSATTGIFESQIGRSAVEMFENRTNGSASSGNQQPMSVGVLDGCVLGDTIFSNIYQSSGGTLTTIAGVVWDHLEIVWIGW